MKYLCVGIIFSLFGYIFYQEGLHAGKIEHNDLSSYLIEQHDKFMDKIGVKHSVGHGELEKNINHDVKVWYEVARNVARADVQKTIDTGSLTIQLTSNNGKIATLWLNLDGTVRDITDY